MVKAAFNKKKNLFICKSDLKLKEGSSKMLHLENNFVRCRKLHSSERNQKYLGSFEMWTCRKKDCGMNGWMNEWMNK